jgi:hypothetical protein
LADLGPLRIAQFLRRRQKLPHGFDGAVLLSQLVVNRAHVVQHGRVVGELSGIAEIPQRFRKVAGVVVDLGQQDEGTRKIRVENHGPPEQPVRTRRIAIGDQVFCFLEQFRGFIPVVGALLFGAALFEHLLAVRGVMGLGHLPYYGPRILLRIPKRRVADLPHQLSPRELFSA